MKPSVMRIVVKDIHRVSHDVSMVIKAPKLEHS
jgi:hypothetical protein